MESPREWADSDEAIQSLTIAIKSLDKTLQTQLKELSKVQKTAKLTKVNSPGELQDVCEKTTVQVRIIFLKLGEIDTVKEHFSADVFIQTKWKEAALNGHTDVDGEDVDWSCYWTPKIYVENMLGEGKEELWHTIMFDDNKEATVVEKRRVKGTFLENMELAQFPFDCQDLTVTVASERAESELMLIEDESEVSSINVQSFVDEQEWRLHHYVETWRKQKSQAYKNAKWQHPTLSISCKARRRAGFFIWNILVVMFFISSLAFGTFSVDIHLPQNRLQLSFTLVLTTIAFKFVTNQSLPKISYLTYLDKYILLSMAMLCSICIWHSILPALIKAYGFDKCGLYDRCILLALGIIFVLFHIIFITKIFFVSVKKRVHYQQKDEAHTAKVDAQGGVTQSRSIFRRITPM